MLMGLCPAMPEFWTTNLPSWKSVSAICLAKGQTDNPKNNLFDVFSGPEVYNPNVDPKTVVNWLGAKGGTRTNVQLAADLSTAPKQAEFESAALSHMREEINKENVNQIRY